MVVNLRRAFVVALAWVFATTPLYADYPGQIPAHTIIGNAQGKNGPPSAVARPIFYAQYTRGAVSGALCIWDGAPSHDVGDCINGAYAAAKAAGGGMVYVPCNTIGIGTPNNNPWYVSTPIVNHTSGIGLQICIGPQVPRDNTYPTAAIGQMLRWNGSAGGTLFDNEPSNGTAISLYRNNISGVFDCNNVAATCVKIGSTSQSHIDVAVSEPTTTGFLMTSTTTDAPGSQDNDIWVQGRCSSFSDATHPTCVQFDGGAGLNLNTSYDRIHDLLVWGNSGDAIVFGYSDTMIVDMVRVFDWPGLTTLGHRLVLANSNYTMPNGLKTNATAGFPGNIHFKQDGAGLNVLGFITGLTFSNGGGNTGTATYTPFNVTLNVIAGAGAGTITVTSSTGVIQNDDIDCGTSTGINHLAVQGVPTGTTIQLVTVTQSRGVPNSTVCAIGIRPTASAVAGTYSIAYNGATYSITAPTGGHSQSGVSVVNGHLSFTDMLIPWAGTPQNGDTWSIVIPTPGGYFEDITDVGNAIFTPSVEPGATGYTDNANHTAPTLFSAAGYAYCVLNWGGGSCPTATGQQALAIGPGNMASGTYAIALGQNASATAFGAVAIGTNVSSNSTYGVARGDASYSRSRWGADCFASGDFAALGDAQVCRHVLRGTTSNTGTARLTADGATADAFNCINIAAITAHTVSITIIAVDHTDTTNNESWGTWNGLLSRVAGNAALTMNATPTPITNGVVTGSSIAATADTTNQCISLVFTPPTGNNHTWRIVANVETVEVQ